MTAPARNIYELEARMRKSIALVNAIDGALSMLGCDPFSAQALEFVLAMNEAAWSEAEKHAQVPPASEQTREEVTDLYRRRLEIRACLSRLA